MADKSARILPILELQPVIPVLTIEDPASALALAHALLAGGLRVIEVTLRTPAAFEAIQIIAREAKDVIVGAGTVLTIDDYRRAEKSGSRFIVSPGTTMELLEAAHKSTIPFLPGVTTASEIMSLREEGFQALKFFPAEQTGGAKYLKSLCAPLAGSFFCPTGGITLENAGEYLSLPNVVCVGGSWIAPGELIAKGDWEAITRLARQAAGLKES